MPPFPRALSYLWEAYLRLRRRTAAGAGGREPIGWEALDAFNRNSGLRLRPWEVRLLEQLDDIFLNPAPRAATSEGKSMVPIADAVAVKSLLGSVARRRVVVRRKSKQDPAGAGGRSRP